MCPAENPTSRPLEGQHATVLLVEDEVIIRLAIAEYLRDHGFAVIEAASPLEARAVFNAGVDIDVVFSDVDMPGDEDGHIFARWISEHFPHVGVLLTSGVTSGGLGAANAHITFVDKPYAREKILAHIQGLLARRAES
jgi:DNA-binding NtrC family response regulator